MRTAIIKAGELGGRWDAAYHVARVERDGLGVSLEAEAERLGATITAAEATALLEGLDGEILAPVRDLARGDGLGPAHARVSKAVRENPLLCLALVARGASASMDTVAERMRAEGAKLDTLATLSGVAGLRPGHLYPLRDAARYDDADGKGYTHVLVSAEFVPGRRVQPAWIVDGAGEVHPGYPDPVPVSPSDVDLSRAALFDLPPPAMAP